MQTTQREVDILRILNDTGSGRIIDISRRLNVTEETIRRNVRRLEAQGVVTKVHGGVQLKDWSPEATFAQRLTENPDAKRKIARKVAAMVGNGASLFLDVGTTTAYVAQALRSHQNLMVVTNSLSVAQTLAMINSNRVFMAGGELRSHDGGAFGAEALAFVGQFRVSFAILSAAALTADAGFLLHDLREAEFSREIIRCAERSMMAVDATKFGRSAPIRIAGPETIDTLITDAMPPPATAQMLAAADVKVVLADGSADT
ncbi:glycerol-3-phosphate regulon repressor [mine drainage metagenome]|uniref:Glycerol-3-phosphate regulon repressor n=1 Tax=mine drainage metagenome TaxID=410659 RepID=A0A1J5QCP4_9ZZZZ